MQQNISNMVVPVKYISSNEGMTKKQSNPKINVGIKRSNFKIMKMKRNPILRSVPEILPYIKNK